MGTLESKVQANMSNKELTYPCVVGSRIVELTAQQRDALQFAKSPPEFQIQHLLHRIQDLEEAVRALQRAGTR